MLEIAKAIRELAMAITTVRNELREIKELIKGGYVR